MIRILIIALAALSLSSCRDDYNICTQSRTVDFMIGLYKISSGQEVVYSAPNFSINYIDPPNTSYSQVNISNYGTPLNANADSTRFWISNDGVTRDTIIVKYTRSTQTISPECGDVTIFNITNVTNTNHSIQNTIVTRNIVDRENLLNLKIFYQ